MCSAKIIIIIIILKVTTTATTATSWLIYTAEFGLWYGLRFGCKNPIATLHYVEIFKLHGVSFRFQSQLPTKGMGSQFESVPESVFSDVNEALPDSFDDNIYSELIVHRAPSLQQPRRLLSKLSSVCRLLCTINSLNKFLTTTNSHFILLLVIS